MVVDSSNQLWIAFQDNNVINFAVVDATTGNYLNTGY